MGTLYAQSGQSPKAKAGQDKALNAAAHAPMFTQRAADKVKEVRDGGNARKQDEAVLDPAKQNPNTVQSGPQPGQDPKAEQAPPPPPPPKVIAWRLKGTVSSKKGAVAVFDVGGPNPVMVRPGQNIDPDAKLLRVSRKMIVVEFDGHQLSMSPW
jgi:hypothetical protein